MTNRFRPQFTLRVLLFAMALIGIVLGMWRWPWVEEELNPRPDFAVAVPNWPSTYGKLPVNVLLKLERFHSDDWTEKLVRARVNYHRGWTGAPLKHGPADYFYDNGTLGVHRLWRDGALHGVETWFDRQGRLVLEQTWRDGELHGDFRVGNGTEWLFSGRYANSKLDGEQRARTTWFNGEAVIHISAWDHGQELPQHRVETLDGQVLESRSVDDGWLTEWNGVPVHDYLHDWSLAGKITNERIARALRANDKIYYYLPDDEQRVYVVRDPSLPSRHNPFRDRIHRPPLSRDLVTACIPWGLAIDWRYENLYVVPAEDVGLWRDSTGVAELDVSAFPMLAAIWNKPFRFGSRYPDQYYPSLDEIYIRWPKDCGVELDLATHFPEWEKRLLDKYSISTFGVDNDSTDEIHPSFQAWLGGRLYQAGLQCELQGNRIVILPHWSQRQASN